MRRLVFLHIFISLFVFAYGQAGYFFPSFRFSSGKINDICQDQYGYIWIATENGLNKFDGYRFTTYLHQPDNEGSLSSNIVVKVYCDRLGQLWVGTRTGISRYDYASDRFIHYPFDDQEKPRVISIMERRNGEFLVGTSGRGLYTLADNRLRKISDGYTTPSGNWYYNQMKEDRQGRFWKCGYGEEVTMKDNQGIHQMMVNQGIVVCFAEKSDEMLIICMHGIHSYRNGQLTVADIDLSALGSKNTVMCSAFQDHEGNIYIGTRGDGLFLLSKDSRRLVRVECRMREMNLNTAKIWTIKEDHNGNIWLGCESKGLVMLPHVQPQFASWDFMAQGYHISSTITSICKGDQDITWCTVQGNGVFGFDSQGHVVAHPQSPPSTEIIYRDRRGRYWIGTAEALYSYDPHSGHSQRQATFICDKINEMTDDAQGNLYISTYSHGFCVYNTTTHSVRHFLATEQDPQKGGLWNNWVMAMMPDHKGYIWMATSSGVCCYDPKNDSFRPYGWLGILDGMMCYSFCETQEGDILIGTDQGLFRYTPGRQMAERFSKDGGLSDKAVGYIAQAHNGDIWCSTPMGIWQYDVRKQKFIGHVNGNGLTSQEYTNCVGMQTNSGTIFLANNDGLTVFRPEEVTGTHKKMPPLRLTGFLIAGNAVNTLTRSNGTPVTQEPTIETDHYTVSYLDNSVSLEFSLLDFNNPSNILFEYRINHGKWFQNPEGQNNIQLSHLQPGRYEIEVRALSAGIYSEVKTITVEVTPPWYRSTLAYLIYAIVILALLGLLGWLFRRRATQQLNEEKMKFLMNATHDIRSPLTLIMGPLAKLKNLVTDENGKAYIETIDRNAQRLMLLVNQILDERRIDKNQMQLHCRETNLVDFMSSICKLYQYNASQRNITFTFEHDKDHLLAWVDRINFDKVISNLLSNAFKYTFDGGEVKVTLCELEKDIEIQVIDNGVGLKEEDLSRLFDRFYQGRNSADLGMQGTGIGLNLSRAITQMHGGQIKARNRNDGQRGACFIVTIPKGHTHLKPEQIVTDSPAREILSAGTNGKQPFRQFRILVVDDDPEIADYIIGELGNRYKFDHASNGKEALKMLLSDTRQQRKENTQGYDLVISDVMMPEMDGITLLRRIKDNPNISQLPVIMLTSKAEVEHKLEGLKSGADAYIAKPFSMEELHIQIDNLIDNVRRLRGKFSGAMQQEERMENIEVKGNDDALMERIMRSVNAHLSDPDFNVDTLAEDVGISRAQLHRKMKDITGISSGKFLRNIRMEQAARLLREGKVNVAQVADHVGYADQAHFSIAFKNHFGMPPSEYVEAHKE